MPKAFKRISVAEIEYFLETGEIPKALEEALEDAVDAARLAPHGEAPIPMFVVFEEDEDDEEDA